MDANTSSVSTFSSYLCSFEEASLLLLTMRTRNLTASKPSGYRMILCFRKVRSSAPLGERAILAAAVVIPPSILSLESETRRGESACDDDSSLQILCH